jgi:hypothetical protein
MKKNAVQIDASREITRSAVQAKLVAIKGTRSRHPDVTKVSTEDRLAELNRLANTSPFCITHRVKKNDML